MSDTKFTPGPWEVPDQTYTRKLTVVTAGGMNAPMILCKGSGGSASYTDEVCELGWKDDGEWLANAHLIAAAPELYEALEMVRDADEDCKVDGFPTMPATARAKIDRALAKARGES